jgi:tetratricopeptide (TPR) repeat protein
MIADRPLTSGSIALLNLDAQIDAIELEARYASPAVEVLAGLVELLALRGQILGRIADYDRAEEIADGLVRVAPTDATAWLTRARTRAGFHRFQDALADLDHAERLGLDVETFNGERAAVFQALGRYDEALALRDVATAGRDSFETLGALTSIHAERGDTVEARRRYMQSRDSYRGVSPLPLALLAFQMGVMWMNEERLDEARSAFEDAVRQLPAYAPAQGHLAEVEAEMGETDTALQRLYLQAACSDDPDYAAQLARILDGVGRQDVAQHWRRFAAERYAELLDCHPEAFADHAAEFWLAAGADADKALRWARVNLEVRDTPRARKLLDQAAAACGMQRLRGLAYMGSDVA